MADFAVNDTPLVFTTCTYFFPLVLFYYYYYFFTQQKKSFVMIWEGYLCCYQPQLPVFLPFLFKK